MRIEIVTWDDAYIETGSCDQADAEDASGIRTHTVGWVLGENQRGVTLTTDSYEDDKSKGHTKIFIPRGMIVKRQRLSIIKTKLKGEVEKLTLTLEKREAENKRLREAITEYLSDNHPASFLTKALEASDE